MEIMFKTGVKQITKLNYVCGVKKKALTGSDKC